MIFLNRMSLYAATKMDVAVAAVLSFALPAVAQGQAVADGPGNTLKVGVIGPFTGASADFGVPMLNGIQQAVDEINAVGGYLGRKLEIVRKDDQANPDVGLKLSQELVAEKVVATIGFCNTGVAAKSLEMDRTHQLLLIIPCATNKALTARCPGPDIYICAVQVPFVAKGVLTRGRDKVAVFAGTTVMARLA